MSQRLEAIRGGGGSIKVGTTGTISALMSRELESAKSASHVPSTSTGDATPRRVKPGSSADEASSSSGTSSFRNHRKDTQNMQKHRYGGSPQVPILTSVDGTAPTRKRPVKKGQGLVEIVDVKCGIPDKTWVNPITHRLKKLSFSRLSNNDV